MLKFRQILFHSEAAAFHRYLFYKCRIKENSCTLSSAAQIVLDSWVESVPSEETKVVAEELIFYLIWAQNSKQHTRAFGQLHEPRAPVYL